MKQKTKKRTLLTLAMLAVMVFAMSIVSGAAASKVSGLRQTKASTTSFTVSWDAQAGVFGYEVAISKDGQAWESQMSTGAQYSTVQNEMSIGKRAAGDAWYVKVRAVERTWNSTSSSYDYTVGPWSDVIQAVVTPEAPKNVRQTKATATKVTLAWDASKGATKYEIFRNNARIATVTKTTVTLKADTGKSEYYKVYPVKVSANGFTAKYDYGYSSCSAKTAPGKAVNVADISSGNLSWNPDTNKCTVRIDRNPNDDIIADGYQFEIKSVDGKKKIKTINTGKYDLNASFTYKAVKNKGFQVRVRGWVVVNDAKQYGSWTKAKVVIPQAKVYLDQVSSTKLKVKWNAVKGATKYTIYAVKNREYTISTSKLKFKKLKTVSGKTTSYTINKLKTGKYTYVYVLPTVKVGKKSYVGNASYYSYLYMSKYY